MPICLLVRSVDQQQRQLVVRFYCKWYCAASGVDVLATRFKVHFKFHECNVQWKISPYKKYIVIAKQKWKYYDFASVINCSHKLTCVQVCMCACDHRHIREQYESPCDLLNKNINFDKKETESKIKNPTHNSWESNLVLQLK